MIPKNPNKRITVITVVAAAHDIPQLFTLHILTGTRLNDFLADAETLSHQLNTSKRIITNMRRAGLLSYTMLNKKGKIYYLRQEAAFILQNNLVISNNRFITVPDYCKKPLTKSEIDALKRINAFKKKEMIAAISGYALTLAYVTLVSQRGFHFPSKQTKYLIHWKCNPNAEY